MPKVCGNPEWAEWVQELADRAEERGEKSSQTYKRAANAIRSCPICFTHPDEALQLTGVGSKIVQYLVGKVKAKCEKEGLPMPDRITSPTRPRVQKAPKKKRPFTASSDGDIDPREARRQRLTKGNPAIPPPGAIAFQAHPDGHEWNKPLPGEKNGKASRAAAGSEPDDVEEEEGGGGKGKGKGKGKAREYIPRQNSGTYAILLSLYKNASYDDRQSWTTKSKIIEDGQEYSNTPFKTGTAVRGGQVQGGHSFTYSAWSGMKTLIGKDLVVSDNKRPAKFALTPAGYALADKLAPSAGIAVHVRLPTSSAHPSSPGAIPPSSSASAPAVTSGPSADRSSFHASAPRQPQRSPPLFLEEAPPRGNGAAEEDEDPEFQAQMRAALELSRRESTAALSSERDDLCEGSTRTGYVSTGGRGLDGRKAASGIYAAIAKQVVATPVVKNVDTAFGYFYLTEDDARTLRRDEAETSQTDDGVDLLFRIEYRAAHDLHPMVRGLKKVAPLTRSEPLPGGMTKSGYIRERVSNLIAPGFQQKNRAGGAAVIGFEKEKASEADLMSSLLGGYKAPEKRSKEAMYAAPPQVRHLGGSGAEAGATRGAASVADVLARFNAAATVEAADDPPAAPATSSSRPSGTRPTPAATAASPKRPRLSATSILADAPRAAGLTSTQTPLFASFDAPAASFAACASNGGPIINRHPLDPVRDHVSSTSCTFTPFSPIVWPAGSFKVYLVVDSREGTREHGKRVELCEKIEREGVKVDGKMMPLGDMIWVAKKVHSTTGRPMGGDDVVLDAIVERKRLDDLCNSIIDGRYVGQKFRLKDSGISHRIYLIEKYDVAAQYEKFGKQIWTCKSQLQVNDGFLVHESANMADTINWLKKRTQIMSEMYESQDLHIIPDSHIERTSYLSLQQHLRQRDPATVYHTTYSSFCELNRPDAALTLRTQWASMIQRVSGVSAEKAVQFLGRWESPRQFWEEACAHEVEVERENEALEAATVGAKGKRQPKKRKVEDFVFEELDDGGTRGIKGKLGAKIWELFMAEGERYAS
ncbi:endonuclease [Rhodotorula toruloides]|uniref:Crossover junction endonuclease MUS81 n=1 Tax=Rhodotorula toruloides TaxID=5286 RepID=A0A511KBB7_RHOTO|nr:endonuclease [Rhodotorula toruloides]